MQAYRETNGVIHIRMKSTETKPSLGDTVNLQWNAASGNEPAKVTEGSELFEYDTGKVYIMGTTWTEV